MIDKNLDFDYELKGKILRINFNINSGIIGKTFIFKIDRILKTNLPQGQNFTENIFQKEFIIDGDNLFLEIDVSDSSIYGSYDGEIININLEAEFYLKSSLNLLGKNKITKKIDINNFKFNKFDEKTDFIKHDNYDLKLIFRNLTLFQKILYISLFSFLSFIILLIIISLLAGVINGDFSFMREGDAKLIPLILFTLIISSFVAFYKLLGQFLSFRFIRKGDKFRFDPNKEYSIDEILDIKLKLNIDKMRLVVIADQIEDGVVIKSNGKQSYRTSENKKVSSIILYNELVTIDNTFIKPKFNFPKKISFKKIYDNFIYLKPFSSIHGLKTNCNFYLISDELFDKENILPNTYLENSCFLNFKNKNL